MPAASGRRTPASSAWLQLAGCTTLAGVVWLAVLPWIAAQPSVHRRVEFLERRQIDPSAMFYTELDAMEGVRDRMAELRRRYPSSFWRPEGEPESSRSRRSR
ncbi:MAG: hypothetical protein JJ992_09095 [Planctomycetes bacterium]|nr:hypothetical protein [Planctomycetota bacterium]